MDGIRERYERVIRKSVGGKLEESRAEICTKIDATTKNPKSYKLGANRDANKIQMEQEYTATEMKGRLGSMLG